MKIAIIDSTSVQAEMVAKILTSIGHDCDIYRSSALLLNRFSHRPYALIVLSLHNPEENGSPIKAIRKLVPAAVPILCLTSSANEYELMECLADGANDYIFSTVRRTELTARVQVLLRKNYPMHMGDGEVQFGSYVFETARTRLVFDGKVTELTRKEFDLALLFFRNAGRPLSRALIMETVWKDESPAGSRTMDTHISRVRTKIGLFPERGFRLSPVYGYGYRMDLVAPRVEYAEDAAHRSQNTMAVPAVSFPRPAGTPAPSATRTSMS